MFESLESRRLLSGTITVTTTGREVLVSGDTRGNSLTISQNESNDGTPIGGFHLSTYNTRLIVDGVTMDPRRSSYSVDRADKANALFTKPWRIDLAGGADFVSIRQAPIPSLQLNLGNGDDYANLSMADTAALTVAAGAGDDTVYLSGVMGTAGIYGGAGVDRINVLGEPDSLFAAEARTRITGKFLIADERGPSLITMAYTDVRRNTAIVVGNAGNSVSFNYCAFSNVVAIRSGSGGDDLESHNTRFRQGTFIRSGDGDDRLVNLSEGLAGYGGLLP